MGKTNADNALNRRHGREGQPRGSMSQTSSGSNANVNLPHGSAVSKRPQSAKTTGQKPTPRTQHVAERQDTSTLDSKYEDRQTPPKQSEKLVSHAQEPNKDSDSKGKVDQEHAISHERELLLTHTSYPSHHDLHEGNQASGCASSHENDKRCVDNAKQEKKYADNAQNRKIGRVGLPLGSIVYSKSTKTITRRVYADTSAVSKRPQSAKTTGQKPSPRTQHVAERQDTSTVDRKYEDRQTPPKQSEKPVTYANNALNKKIGRVGLPVGSMVYSKSTKTITSRVYADTPLNRNLGRVGKPLGSMPRKNIVTNKIPEMIEKLHKEDKNETDEENGTESDCFESQDSALQQAMCHNNRQRAEDSWKVSNKEPPKTEMSMLRDYTGKRIAYNELQLHSKIGQGGFGEIYFAKWRETVVAVKALKIEKMTDKDVNTFAEEVLKFCHLNHPNIVKFIGACTERPDICIVMEYMMFSLFDAIHVRQIQFADEEKLSINQQICKGINYLHDKRIAHCDIKTANILMDYVENKICEVKITDFGLSLVTNATLSLSQPQVQYRGTPRYSAPEILRGEILGIRDMMHADVYSLGLVMFEIIYEEEPYHDFTAIQMHKQVGEHGVMPEISNDIIVDPNVLDIIHKAWNFEPHLRPKIGKISDFMNRTVAIFVENEC